MNHVHLEPHEVDTLAATPIGQEIEEFWQANPCGQHFVQKVDWRQFFIDYDRYKYQSEPHILVELGKTDFRNKRVLEIGPGQGAEAQKIIESGGIYSGLDLTQESVNRVKKRLEIFNLPYERVSQGSAERLAWPDCTFDIVFSHGVIHHSPRITAIVDEIHRVLKPNGEVVLMLYHRHSINYQVSIRFVRRAGIFLLFMPGIPGIVCRLTGEPLDRLLKHRSNLKQEGLSYLRMHNFVHKSTDGPDNVYSSVYSVAQVRQLLRQFRDLRFSKHLLNERHLLGLQFVLSRRVKQSLEARFGWHLWVRGRK